jgi:hypothetical protein
MRARARTKVSHNLKLEFIAPSFRASRSMHAKMRALPAKA